jgi:predicted RNA-binding Zn-ribbon protein involved in translation (DUF1610 family)
MDESNNKELMVKKQHPKGPWINRIASRILTFILGILIYWLLGFLVEDIKQTRGPDYQEIEKRHVEANLIERKSGLTGDVEALDRQMKDQKEEQRLVGDSSQNLQKTIDQLLDLKRLSIEKEIELPQAEQNNLTDSLSAFLENQTTYQDLNKRITENAAQKRKLEAEVRTLGATIEDQRRPARDEYNKLEEKHHLRLAAYQLAILTPLLLIGGFLVIKRRSSIYFPLYFASGGATLLKVILVIHDYFPTRYFKYILIGVLLIVVGRILIHFIRMVAFPKTQWLLRQYREAYERFLCPMCEYPIRTGPRRFLYWTRRTVTKRALQVADRGGNAEETYTCPACGTELYTDCDSCHKVRHALLPSCQHCGAKKEKTSLPVD